MTPDKARDKVAVIYERAAPTDVERRIFANACGHLIGRHLYTKEEAVAAMHACCSEDFKARAEPKRRPANHFAKRNHKIRVPA